MEYRLYFLSIRELEDKEYRQTAISCLDSYRRELVNHYKQEEDQLRAIAAGLLLQAGFAECDSVSDVKNAFPLSYNMGLHGKPSWKKEELYHFKPDKKYWHFNLSHSGEFVVLAVADCPVGVDVQQKRACKYPGGYEAFSRMEAYVKCTGEGWAAGKDLYEKQNGQVPGYKIERLTIAKDYALYVCLEEET